VCPSATQPTPLLRRLISAVQIIIYKARRTGMWRHMAARVSQRLTGQFHYTQRMSRGAGEARRAETNQTPLFRSLSLASVLLFFCPIHTYAHNTSTILLNREEKRKREERPLSLHLFTPSFLLPRFRSFRSRVCEGARLRLSVFVPHAALPEPHAVDVLFPSCIAPSPVASQQQQTTAGISLHVLLTDGALYRLDFELPLTVSQK
jgi:hypothetical protein